MPDPTTLSDAEKRELLKRLLMEKAEAQLVAELERDASQPLPPRCTAHPVVPLENAKAVLVTGATGYLGAFLVHELLRRTSAAVYCLVRAASPEQARERLEANLKSVGIWEEAQAGRLHALSGDLSKPRLGLSAGDHARVAEGMDAFFLSGALVNFLFAYADARSANVLGTVELLRLATMVRPKPVHYVSSVSVFCSDKYSGTTIFEGDWPGKPAGLYFGGYAQSKWVSEQLIRRAIEAGIPATVYRPAFIGWHSKVGSFGTDNFMCRMIEASVKVGAAPDINMLVAMAPVDFVAGGLVSLALREDSVGRAFHLLDPNPVDWSGLVDLLREGGRPLRKVPYDVWRSMVAASPEARRIEVFGPLFPSTLGTDGRSVFDSLSRKKMPAFDAEQVRRSLGPSHSCPRMSTALLDPFLRWIPR